LPETLTSVRVLTNMESEMKTYTIRKKSNGYQVVWFWGNSFTGSEFEVENGFFKSLSDAENLANNLQYGSEG
jgi:hypothetical protein